MLDSQGENVKKEIIKAVVFIGIGMGMMYFIQKDDKKVEIEKVVNFPGDKETKKIFDNISQQMQKMMKDGNLPSGDNQPHDIQAIFDKSLKMLKKSYSKEPVLEKSQTDKHLIYTINSKFVDFNKLKFQVSNNILKVRGITKSVEKTQTGERIIEEEFVVQESLPTELKNQDFRVEKDDTLSQVQVIFNL